MCTVTIVPTPEPVGGVRIACNRDESRRRPAASPPQAHSAGGRKAIHPTDPESGGTWVAVSDAGLFFTLLNRNPRDMRQQTYPGRRSRGTIIPALLDAASLRDAYTRAQRLVPTDYAPFRLVMTDGRAFAEVTADDTSFEHRTEPIPGLPVMFTSSGIGDDKVEYPRRELFEQMFTDDPAAWSRIQDAFHRHRWINQPELSVCMTRDDALTVSLTVVTLRPDAVEMTYHGAPPDEPAEDVSLSLPRDGGRETEP